VSAVGLAVDLQDDGAINDPIQECRREGRVAEVIAPGLEVDVGGQGGRALAGAGVDDLEEEVGGLRGLLAFDVIEAKLVKDQQVETGVMADPLGQGLVGQGRGQIFQQGGAGDVADGVTERTDVLADGLDQEVLAVLGRAILPARPPPPPVTSRLNTRFTAIMRPWMSWPK
jgi:hypothetical protein